jgi:tetratricopeptide (TPR) repeat protein
MSTWAGACLLVVSVACCGGGPHLTRGDADAIAAAQAAVDLVATGNRPSAITKLEAAIERYPKSYELRFEFARVASNSRFTAPALDTFEMLMIEDPGDLDVPRNYARLATFTGQLERAKAPIAVLLGAAQPSSADYTAAARLAFELGDTGGAKAAAEKAIAKDSGNADAHLLLGKSLLEAGGDDQNAMAVLAKALELNPGLTAARYAYGTLLLQTGNEAGRSELDRWETSLFLASPDFTLMKVGERVELSRVASKALPNWSLPWVEIARAQLELGQPRKAEESLLIAFKRAPITLEIFKLSYAAARAQNDSKNADLWLKRWKAARENGPSAP